MCPTLGKNEVGITLTAHITSCIFCNSSHCHCVRNLTLFLIHTVFLGKQGLNQAPPGILNYSAWQVCLPQWIVQQVSKCASKCTKDTVGQTSVTLGSQDREDELWESFSPSTLKIPRIRLSDRLFYPPSKLACPDFNYFFSKYPLSLLLSCTWQWPWVLIYLFSVAAYSPNMMPHK